MSITPQQLLQILPSAGLVGGFIVMLSPYFAGLLFFF